MLSRRLCVASALIFYFVAASSAEPSCDGVVDFGSCDGDTGGFCPNGITCSCKAGHAFCSCPNYKGPHADYWYMGAKCDLLWSTWDLVIMIVFPGVALAFVVAVVAQLIHFCKSTAKIKTPKEKKSNHQTTESYHNQTFEPDVQPRQNAAARNVEDPPLQGLNSYYPDAGRKALYADIKRVQSQNFGRPSYGYPDQDYDIEQPQPRQFSRFGAPSFPQADYGQGGPNAGFGNGPFGGRRPQAIYDY